MSSDELPTLSQSLGSCMMPKWSDNTETKSKRRDKKYLSRHSAYLFVTEDPLDVSNRLPTSDDETVLDRERDRASDPFAFTDIGASQHIVSFGHDPEYVVFLW
jgi:hypothetical protein